MRTVAPTRTATADANAFRLVVSHGFFSLMAFEVAPAPGSPALVRDTHNAREGTGAYCSTREAREGAQGWTGAMAEAAETAEVL